ncbi:helix-turn-helix domain-containing protein [Spirochaeta dissipatitropha]
MNIGFLTANIHSGSGPILWQSMSEHIEKEDQRLFIFVGGRLQHPDPVEMHMNHILSLAASDAIDGNVAWASALSGTVSREGVQAYLGQFTDKPLVSIEMPMPNAPSVSIDVYSGMKRLLDHMVRFHGAQRIAFLRGPSKHRSSEDRFHAFRDYVLEQDLGWDERLVSSPVEWNMGAEAVREITEKNGMIPHRDFDVLIGTSDLLVYNAVLELAEMGWKCPDDYRAAGFNDSPESELLTPAVTTVRMPFREVSKEAVQLLGKKDGEDTSFSTQLIIRRSCGCFAHSYDDILHPQHGPDPGLDWSRTELEQEMLKEIQRTLQIGDFSRQKWVDQILSALMSLVDRIDSGSTFLQRFDQILNLSMKEHIEAQEWQEAIAAVHCSCRRILPVDLSRWLVPVFERAQIFITDAAEKAAKSAAWQENMITEQLQLLDHRLLTASDFTDLSRILFSVLPGLGVDRIYTVLYEDKHWRVASGYDEKGLIHDSDNRLDPVYVIPAESLLSEELLQNFPLGRSYFILPLCDESRQYGHAVVALGIRDGRVYEQIRLGLTGALRNLQALSTVRIAMEAARKAEEVKTRFLQNASSGLMEPLQRIRSGISQWKSYNENNSPVSAEFDRIIALLNDMQDLAHSQSDTLHLDFSAVHPAAFIDSVLHNSGWTETSLSPQRLPLIDVDRARLNQIVSGIIQMYPQDSSSCNIRTLGKYSRQGVHLLFSIRCLHFPDFDHIDNDPIWGLYRKIMILHSGELKMNLEPEEHHYELVLPYSSISGSRVSIRDWASLTQLSDGDFRDTDIPVTREEGETALAGLAQSGGLLCDIDLLSPSEWKTIQRLRRIPAAHHIPLLLFTDPAAVPDQQEQMQTGNLLFHYAAESVPGPVVWFPDREASYNHLDDLVESADLLRLVRPEDLALVDSDQIPSLFVVENRDMSIVTAIRDNTRWTQIPILLVDSEFQHIDPAARDLDFFQLMLLHRGVFRNDELSERIESFRQGRKKISPQTSSLVKKAVLYFDRHFQENVSRWKLASSVHVSEDYLTRIFHKDMGISPWEYLSRLRIARSCELLRHSTQSIQEIAQLVGFSDQAYFCRVFRKVTGNTPSKYRSLKKI